MCKTSNLKCAKPSCPNPRQRGGFCDKCTTLALIIHHLTPHERNRLANGERTIFKGST